MSHLDFLGNVMAISLSPIHSEMRPHLHMYRFIYIYTHDLLLYPPHMLIKAGWQDHGIIW